MGATINTAHFRFKKVEALRDSEIWFRVTYSITYLNSGSLTPVQALSPSSLPFQHLLEYSRDFLGGAVDKTSSTQCRGPGFDLCSGN